jgi:hypothetical protein
MVGAIAVLLATTIVPTAAQGSRSDEALARTLGRLIAAYESHPAKGIVRAASNAAARTAFDQDPALREAMLAAAEAHGAADPIGALALMAEEAAVLGLGSSLAELYEILAPPPDWGAIIAALLEDAEQYADPDSIFPVTHSHTETLEEGGTVIGYMVWFRQWIDPEGGIQRFIIYALDTDFEIVGVQVQI